MQVWTVDTLTLNSMYHEPIKGILFVKIAFYIIIMFWVYVGLYYYSESVHTYSTTLAAMVSQISVYVAALLPCLIRRRKNKGLVYSVCTCTN